MTRALRFTRAEVANAARIAREHGVAVKLDRDGSLIVIPDINKIVRIDDKADDEGSSLQRWRESRNAGKAYGRP